MIKFYLKKILLKTRLIYLSNLIRSFFNLSLSTSGKTSKNNYIRFKKFLGKSTLNKKISKQGYSKKVLFISFGDFKYINTESIIIKAFELAGYQPTIMLPYDYWLRKTWKLFNLDKFIWWESFDSFKPIKLPKLLSNENSDFRSLINWEKNNIKCGKYAISTMMRKTRVGGIEKLSNSDIQELKLNVERSVKASQISQKIITKLKPDALVLIDNGYTPTGELFETCVNNNIPVFSWHIGHKDNTIMFKRFDKENASVHPSSISDKSWDKILKINWTRKHWAKLEKEIYDCYMNGQWYSEVGTQFNKKLISKKKLIQELAIDESKKTAIIFPHIFWDATFFWGEDLFASYEEWFIETIRVAIDNKNLNWIIKIHPANIIKNQRDGYRGSNSELETISENFGSLPSHIRIIKSDSKISTFSLYQIANYCITVRGTTGIEAACFGCTILTAGTGRYDGKGFTIDSKTDKEYLEKIATLEKIPFITNSQIVIARKYAYGLFLMRVLPLNLVKMEYKQDAYATLKNEFLTNDFDDILNSRELNAIKDWVNNKQEDYIDFYD